MGRATNLTESFKVKFYVSRHTEKVHVKTAFITAKDHKSAERIANTSFPNVISVSKAKKDYFRIASDELNTLTNNLMKDTVQPRMTPLAMDEFIWKRRNKRIENRDKDKKDT